MADVSEPVVLELAPLSREQIGPFFLLGIDKDAEPEQVDAAWAERIKGARRGQHAIPLEDINWAREIVNDPERRVRADVMSLNADTADGFLRRLAEQYSLIDGPTWQPVEQPQSVADYSPAVEVPEAAEILHSVTLPDIPLELPLVARLLKQFAPDSLDPWSFDIGMEEENDA
jgi:hypothetical protein